MRINRLYFWYIMRLYTKNVLAILVGLSFVFALIDYLNSASEIKGSANQHILYIYYVAQKALSVVYPLALIFGAIMTKSSMVKQNTIGALHSFGYTKSRLLTPILIVALTVYLSFVWLQTTEFAHADEDAFAIRTGQNSANSKNLFFKYNNTYVYIDELDAATKQIKRLSLFETKNNQVLYTMKAPYADFDGKSWVVHNGTMQTYIYKDDILKRYQESFHKTFVTLKGYKPTIMDSLQSGKDMTLIDAFATLKLLKKQKMETAKIRATIYEKIIFPLFVFGAIIVLFIKIPSYARFANSMLVSAFAIGGTLVSWGLLMGFGRLSLGGVISPEIAYGLPVIILSIYAFYLFIQREKLS